MVWREEMKLSRKTCASSCELARYERKDSFDARQRCAYRRAVDAPERIIARRYRLRSLVGRGGHGTVWIADDLLLGNVVAVKLLDERRTEWSRIRREIATLRALRLDGVVRLLDEGLDEQQSFLVMEYVEGAPFPGVVQEKPQHWAEIAECTLRILETLAHLHAAGVVHRDLKPDNVLVRHDGSPILIDFGLSSLLHSGESDAQHRLMGTPLYAAPEQLRGETIDTKLALMPSTRTCLPIPYGLGAAGWEVNLTAGFAAGPERIGLD